MQKEKGRAGARPSPSFDSQALGVELLDCCLDRVDDALLVDLEALLLQEVDDVLLLLLAAAGALVELLSSSDADLYPRGQLLALCLGIYRRYSDVEISGASAGLYHSGRTYG